MGRRDYFSVASQGPWIKILWCFCSHQNSWWMQAVSPALGWFATPILGLQIFTCLLHDWSCTGGPVSWVFNKLPVAMKYRLMTAGAWNPKCIGEVSLNNEGEHKGDLCRCQGLIIASQSRRVRQFAHTSCRSHQQT